MRVDIVSNIEVCQYLAMSNSGACCPSVLQGTLGKREAEDLAATLKALADPIRLQLLSYIAAQPDAECCVCYLTEPVGVSQPTVSHHLKVLHTAGLLERNKRGAWVYYKVVPSRLEALRTALATRAPRPRVAKRT